MRLVWRVMRVAMTILVVGILSSLLTIGTTAIVVDRYIQTALDKFQIPVERKPLTLTSMWGVLLGSDTQTASIQNNTPIGKIQGGTLNNSSGINERTDNNGQQATQKGQGSKEEDRGTSNPSTDKTNEGESGSHMAPDGSLPVMGGISSGQESKGREAIIVPPESISKSKEELSKEKKDQIFATLMKKLPQEDWQRISTLMEGGLTSSEVIEVEQILAKHLNDEEYKEMREWMVGESKTTDTANTKESKNEGTGTP
ncbi:spore coat protein [Paenibacillus alvei]|uniref:spore coat protein n=1 Tax=Paenibacillus alvei TaxID=44250 RepID=UPI0018CFC3E4|nr:spore coat protein [Paenibacillus alvei]MBG9734403.1 spore coat protein [Paenibacillus alvei]MBG9744295.1 spore coat protein [Paenibacillus alvei]MCY9578018.1 spore coat protein [Paenibacillus alvei]MCY9585312.1 spore coat protein [Paenibacillus alvei]